MTLDEPGTTVTNNTDNASFSGEDTKLTIEKRPLTPFGLELFNLLPTAVDTTIGAVDEFYPIGPGDEIIVNVWGDLELSVQSIVKRDGTIDLPRLGPLSVSGVRLGELENTVTRFLAASYSSVRDGKSSVDVSLGSLRTIHVFVVGEVRRPGIYYLSATATMLSALYQTGGILEGGSLRQINLVRHDQVIGRFDFYNFILFGDKSEDLRIQNGDVIQVPPATKRVTVQGEVYRPAIYELDSNEGLRHLLDIAGGLSVEAFADRLQIERVVDNRERQLLDVNLNEILDSSKTLSLFNGDVVSVFKIPEKILNSVMITGFVKRPGQYQFLQGMRVKDLVIRSDYIFPQAYLGRADLLRTNPDLTKKLMPFHLGKALADDSQHNHLLNPLDLIRIYSIHTFGDSKVVSIAGEVRNPGKYEAVENMTLQDLVVRAGGLTDFAHRLSAEIARFDPQAKAPGRPVSVFATDVSDDYEIGTGSEILADSAKPVMLQNRDAVFIRRNPDYRGDSFVKIKGEVAFPGTYVLTSPGERLVSVINRTGGLTPSAFSEGIEFRRTLPEPIPTASTFAIPIDLERALKDTTSAANIRLQHGDEITVPTAPASVSVSGEVFLPGAVVYEDGKSAMFYIEKSGGTTRNADYSRIFVVGPSGSTTTTKRFLFWRIWPGVAPGSSVVIPSKHVSD